jgi:integrase
MIKRRADAGGVPDITCHAFRATGITAYLQNGGTLEKGAADRQSRVAAHTEAHTTAATTH